MTIKALLFDFGGTLDNDGTDWFTRLYQAISKRDDRIDFESYLLDARQAADHMATMEGTISLSMEETVLRLSSCMKDAIATNRNLTIDWNPKDIANDFMEKSYTYLKRNYDFLKKLSESYRLGCISNNWGNAQGWCEQFNYSDFFETVIDSTQVNSVKPDSVIFQSALDDLSLPAEQCVYIGDKYECDVIGAHNMKMKPVWITSLDSSYDTENINPQRIESLTQLPGLNWS